MDPNQSSIIRFTFSEPTTLIFTRGNGTRATYSTTLVDEDHIILFQEVNSSSNILPSYAIGRYSYGSSITRYMSFDFKRELLIGITLNNIKLPNQYLSFPFNDYPNLKTFNIQLIEATSLNGSIQGLRLDNVDKSNITYFSLRRAVNSSSELYTIIPVNLFNCPLVTLILSGNYQDYTISNTPLIGTKLSTTLEILTFSVPITQASGLPSSFSSLTKLKIFIMVSVANSFDLVTFPAVANNWVNLETFNFSSNTGNSSMTSFGCDFSNMPNLSYITLAFNIRNITNFTFISQFKNKIKTLDFRGINVATRMTDCISAIYALITSKASMIGNPTDDYRGLTISLENAAISGSTAAIPTGTYTAPTGYVQGSSNGTVTATGNDLQKLWVLVNQYGCTVTYRAS